MPERTVRIQRVTLFAGFAEHWRVKVGGYCYQVISTDADLSNLTPAMRAEKSQCSDNTGEIVGVTQKRDDQIDAWRADWKRRNPRYFCMTANCQKFAFEMMVWLTGGTYHFNHRVDAALLDSSSVANGGFAVEEGGNAMAGYTLAQEHKAAGPLSTKAKVVQVKAQAVRGKGAFLDATLAEAEVGLGNFGVKVGLNANTGVGERDDGYEAHLVGFGGRVDENHVELNTPFGGVSIPNPAGWFK